MYTTIHRIGGEEAEQLARAYIPMDEAEIAALRGVADRCDPAVSVWFGDELLCLGGFYPLSLLSTTAFVWMQHTEAAFRHPVAIIRTGRMVMDVARKRYPKVIGTCSLGERSENWLRSLGAKFLPSDTPTKPFVIEG